MGRLLLIGIITLADDQGRCKANPAYLRSQIFPYEDIATSDIEWWLERMADNETVILYTVSGKAYLQLVNWWTYQPLDWARASEYPAPEGWQDRIRFNAKGNHCLTYNWTTKSGNRLPDTCDNRGVGTQVGTQVPTQASTQVNKTKLNKTKVTTSDDDSAPTWRSVVDTYQHEIGTITPTISEEMQAAYDDVGAIMVIDAIKEAARANVRKWSYVNGILARWATNGRSAPKNGSNAWANMANVELPDYMQEA